MTRIPESALLDFGARYLAALGVREADASFIARCAVETEEWGVTTHGLASFPYFDRAVPGSLDPHAAPRVLQDAGAVALIDGCGGFGQLAMRTARDLAAVKARKHGIALVGARNCAWIAALGIYLEPLAREGLFSQLCAQYPMTRECAPAGGIDSRFSTNPVAYAFPAPGDPVIADFATTAVAMARVKRMAARGEKAPEPLFRDRNGLLTDDPKAVFDGGSILFLGGAHHGHKGYAMSLWHEALAAMIGADCNKPEAKTRQSFTLFVADPTWFGSFDLYSEEIDRFRRFVKSSRPVPGGDEVRMPGERAFRMQREARELGVPVGEEMLADLERLAKKTGIGGIGADS